MNLALKKIELIEWLSKLQDESLIQKVEALRKDSAKGIYEQRMPKNKKDLDTKLARSRNDIRQGRVHSQVEVENLFKSKFNK
jgi:hypothetical protein